MSNPNRPAVRIGACTLALVLAATGTAALGQTYGGLKNTPAEKFDDEDNRLFMEAFNKALDAAAVGETVAWVNPKTESHGELKVLKTFTWKDNACRQLRIHNESHGRKATQSPNLCKIADKWRAVSASDLEKR